MKKLLLILLITSSFFSCKKSLVEIPEKPIDKPTTIKPAKIELTFERAVIKANGIEQTALSTKVTDANGNALNEACTITMNGSVFTGVAFKTNIHGDYTFQASIGSLLSNTFVVKANENLDGKPFKIELTTDKVSSFIAAYNVEEVNFLTKVTDINGTILTDKPILTINNNPFSGTSFKTGTPGTYVFQASLGTIKSNTKTIYAEERAEKYVTIESSSINSINSVGLVSVKINFKNISNKQLKYVVFTVTCFNAVNDVIREEINGKSSITFNATGFWQPNVLNSPAYYIGYFTGTKSVKVALFSVTLEDGTVIDVSK